MTGSAAPLPCDRPVVAVTMGDPAGVGPELCLRMLDDPEVATLCRPLVFGNAGILARVADHTGLTLGADIIAAEDWPCDIGGPSVVSCGAMDATRITPGQVQQACGRAAYAYIQDAVRAALDGTVAAVVTCPINKEALNLADVPYPGHTEILAQMTGAPTVRMMMASDELIVVLATIHTALSEVPGKITRAGVFETIRAACDTVTRLGRPSRVVVCGLNPHAGEEGLFGTEEQQAIVPAIEEARRCGFDIEGPVPADTAFLPAQRARTGAYVVMYHDQGLIPFKMLAFETGVNVTLGLPVVRTSVDHGTAFDIAWQGKASASSLVSAIRWALALAAPARGMPRG